MKSKNKLYALITLVCALVVSLSALVFTAGCSTADKHKDMVKVTYELEGGMYDIYQYLSHYYAKGDESGIKIADPDSLANTKCTYSGHHVEGWYRTKTVADNGDITYSDKWNFETDRLKESELTLYCKWERDIKYRFTFYYKDGDKKVDLGALEVKANIWFSTYSTSIASLINGKREGYTPVSYSFSDGSPVDEKFVHPGGETDKDIEILVNYMQGEYSLVSKYTELLTALQDKTNIYLTADINCGAKQLDMSGFKGEFAGNGHSVYNFTITKSGLYTNSDAVQNPDPALGSGNILIISLFGDLSGANIHDVSFGKADRKVKVNLTTFSNKFDKIIISPFAVKATDSTVNNVKFYCEYKLTLNNWTEEDKQNKVEIVTDCAKIAGEGFTVENYTADLTPEAA